MRTTLNTIYNNINNNLHNIKTDLNDINNRISSGRRMSKISDDPVDMSSALGMRSNLAGIGQYQDNLDYGSSIIDNSESSLTQVKDLISKAKVTGLEARNTSVNDDQRRNIAEVIKNYKEEIITLGNNRIDGKYIFGGHRTSGYTETEPAPFIQDKIDGYRINGTEPEPYDPDSPPDWSNQDIDDLRINGIDIEAATSDDVSSINPTKSAAAKAAAINAKSEETGVTAQVTPAYRQAEGAVEEGSIESGDLTINGVDIFTESTAIKNQDSDNTLIEGINNKQDETGVTATRNAEGKVLLKAGDGRNLQIETSEDGESITRLNGADSNQVYTGRVQLHSDQPFTLESDVDENGIEPGLEALGLAGGQEVSGEPGDEAGDGRISVRQVIEQEGEVRYTGDRDKNLNIKTGRTDSMEVSSNGRDALMSTGIFSTLTDLENSLRGQDYHRVTGIHEADDLTASLNSGKTGLEGEDKLEDGTFTIQVKDHEHSPPEELEFAVPVDKNEDSLSSVAAKINGIPGMEAQWNDDNRLEMATTDPDRYSFNVSQDSSNFLEATGADGEQMQMQAIDQSLTELEDSSSAITSRISDFGARANRIEVQKQIYSNLELKVNENLSNIQDTDYSKAIMDLKSAQTAYQAALSSASKTMQLSLVDYL
ncbi:MAG: flagellin hook IN motif-containing protein [Desulfurivibrionaceae bacterium]